MALHTACLDNRARALGLCALALAACNRPDDDDLLRRIDDAGGAPLGAPPPVAEPVFALGQALFFDPILAGNRDVACATCHHPTLGTGDDRSLPLGVGGIGLGAARTGGQPIARSSPPLFGLRAFETMFWDGRIRREGGRLVTPAGDAITAEMESVLSFGVVAAQAMFPVTSRVEMRGERGDNELAAHDDDDFAAIWQGLMARLGAVPAYVSMFEAAYPGTPFSSMSFAHAANAIAAFEIAAFDGTDSPYQRFVDGDPDALDPAQRDGARMFFEEGCDQCHRGPLLSDFEAHNTGLAQLGPGMGHGAAGNDDLGFAAVGGGDRAAYAFRTPPLLNVALTAPYGHAGQFESLRAFVEHYDNPRQSLERYDVRDHVADASLWPTVLDNQQAILETLDRDANVRRVNATRIVAFLEALTADSARDLRWTVPDSVPSGLSME